MTIRRRRKIVKGLKRRVPLIIVFLLLFLTYHLTGAILGPILLDWPTAGRVERKEFCLAEAQNYAACVRGGR